MNSENKPGQSGDDANKPRPGQGGQPQPGTQKPPGQSDENR